MTSIRAAVGGDSDWRWRVHNDGGTQRRSAVHVLAFRRTAHCRLHAGVCTLLFRVLLTTGRLQERRVRRAGTQLEVRLHDSAQLARNVRQPADRLHVESDYK
jgi:hypothetical protein